MKEFFEDLTKRIGETAEAVTNKAGEAVEIQRLKNQIRSLERENEKDFAEIGKRIYRLYQENTAIDEAAAGYCEAIKSREGSIREYHHKMAKVRGTMKCHTCGKMVEKEMAFCPYCGAKAEKTEEAQDMEKQTGHKAADAVEKAANKTADAIDQASQKTTDTVEKVVRKTADAADKAVHKTADIADKAVHKTADMADKAAEKTADMTQKAAEKVADMAEKVADKAADIAGKTEKKAEE